MAETPGRITLWGVEVFLACAEEGAISAAARRLGASPSSVSQQLSNLEAALGTTLLDRSTRPVTLTPAGGLFRHRAQAILDTVSQARSELAPSDLVHRTRFRLGMIDDFDADVTPRLLSGMAGDLSAYQFLLETGASHRLFGLLESRALDVIVASELGSKAGRMKVRPLLVEPFIVVAPRHAVDPGAPLAEELRRLPFIQYTTRHYIGRLIEAHLLRHGLRVGHRFELDSYHAIMAMVAEGAGWSILPPVGVMRAPRFRAAVDLLPLPLPTLSRTISLTARRETLKEMPDALAIRLRPLLEELVVAPCLAQMPWLSGKMRVL